MIDSLGMRDALLGLPEQMQSAMDAIGDISGLPDPASIEHVLILGMGDSGFGGDVAAASARPFSSLPIVVYGGYLPPSWVGRSTLVIAISKSGTTEETLESLEAAVESGASLVAVTSGGELESLARRANAPVLPVTSDAVMPRGALGALAVPPMLALEQLGYFPGARAWLDEAVHELRGRRDDILGSGNPARVIADRIGSTMPVIYGGGATGTTAAKRWKVAYNHNAKSPAFWAPMPELCHNELVGWGGDFDTTELFTQIQLRHDSEHPQTAHRFEFVKQVTQPAMHDVVEVEARGDGPVAQLLDLIFLGDLVSIEAASDRGVDPGPLPEVDGLKTWVG